MPDRRRAAVVLTPLLGLLAALLAGWGVAAAQAPDPLTLTIAAERSECTAGTLNPVTWEISGGTPPYTLTIDGTPVDADAGSATVLCGALPRGASEAPATFMAVVTDSGGTTVTAHTAYTIVPPFHGPLFSERAAGVAPLSLTLTALRAECTAGTLNPVVWTIRGGTPPDTLTIDGEPVDADAERTTVTCGHLPAGATEAPGTITASVTDAAGTTVTARATYTIVPPLPPPTGVNAGPNYTLNFVFWDGGEVGDPYLVRWRAVAPDFRTPYIDILRTGLWTTDLDSWTTALRVVGYYDDLGPYLLPLALRSTYEVAVAKARHRIERETPGALRWSAPVLIATYSPPPALTRFWASATHDTITVTGDPPPDVKRIRMVLQGPYRQGGHAFTTDDGMPDQVVFRNLPPDTWYTIEVFVEDVFRRTWPPDAEIGVRTAVAPAGWRPLPRGPQNLRTTVTHESVTVNWDAPYAGADDVYTVELTPREAQGAEEAIVSGGVTTHTFTGLAPATPYRVWVAHSEIVPDPIWVDVTTPARPAGVEPLALTLTAGRSECTAGTRNPVSWTITGGTPPDTLTIDGEPVNAAASGTTLTCGDLPEGAAEAPAMIEASVTDAGDYAFLTDPDDLTTMVTTYEGLRDGSTTGLVIHKTDSAGASQADFYDLVEAGDIVEWREANDCFVRYPVTEVKDDPAGDPPRKLLAVKVMTYAFTGCSGAISTRGTRTITWSPANLQSPDMTIPIRHGPWQFMPRTWTGEREAEVDANGPPELLTESDDLDTVRQSRYWRDPELPTGWRLFQAVSWTGSTYGGIQAWYAAPGEGPSLEIIIYQLEAIGRDWPSTQADHQLLILETRIIDGHPAYVEYSPTDSPFYSTAVSIYDEATGIVYYVGGHHSDLDGANIDGAIAIARSLYR